MGESQQTKLRAKWQRLVIRTFLVTIGIAVLITLLTSLFLVDPGRCRSVERGLMVVGAATALLFVASVVVVGVGVWKAIPTVAERMVIVVGYGAMILASFVAITCGMMVVFNC